MSERKSFTRRASLVGIALLSAAAVTAVSSVGASAETTLERAKKQGHGTNHEQSIDAEPCRERRKGDHQRHLDERAERPRAAHETGRSVEGQEIDREKPVDHR